MPVLFAADTVGRNMYAWPTATFVGGVPDIRGACRTLVLEPVLPTTPSCGALEVLSVAEMLEGSEVLALLPSPPQPAKPKRTTAIALDSPIDFIILTPEPISNERSSGAKPADR